MGRGAFAGPVGIGGVLFSPNLSSNDKKSLLSLGIKDSKKLTPKKRESLAAIIKENCLSYYVSFIDVLTINEIGIGKATFMGMEEVVKSLKLKVKNPFLLIDAYEIPSVSKTLQKGIVYGDNLSISIAAASIVAKVTRDEYMRELSSGFEVYDWVSNKGYGTKKHRDAIKMFGQTPHHRMDFCRNI